MMTPKHLDLFCCAGGASTGYTHAGFEVYGVDIEAQPRYPFKFLQWNAIGLMKFILNDYRFVFSDRAGNEKMLGLDDFDAIAASPPCQHYSDLAKRNANAHMWPDLVPPTRALLEDSGKPYIIENVEGAPLIDPVLLCGTMFPELRVIRHRLFESNVDLVAPAHIPRPAHPLVFTHDKRKPHYGKLNQDTDYVMVNGGGNCSVANARDAMGIDWMTKKELNESIPPAYTEYLGKQLLEQL